MKFLIIDKTGHLLPLAKTLDREGFDVAFSKEPEGIYISTAPLTGIPSIGISESIYPLLTNREYFLRVCEVLGIATPQILFAKENFDKAKACMVELRGFPAFEVSEEDSQRFLSFFNEHNLIHYLYELPKEEYIRCELEVWFNGIDFILPSYLIFEGEALHPVGNTKSKLNDILAKFLPAMRKLDFKGPISLHLILTKKNYQVANINSTFRPIVFEVLRKTGETLNGIWTGSLKILPIWPEWTMQVSLTRGIALTGAPILGISSYNQKHLWLYNIDEEKGIIKKGNTSLGYIMAKGINVREALRRVERTYRNLSTPFLLPLFHGKGIEDKYRLLQEWEWV